MVVAGFRARHRLTDNSVSFDAERLAMDDGWVIWDRDELTGSGYLGICFPDPITREPLVIAIDPALSAEGRRFVILHELGHYECGHAPKVIRSGRLSWCGGLGTSDFHRWVSNEQEVEANAFAALVLMPAASLVDCDCIAELALRCGVPYDVAELRWSMVAPVMRVAQLRVA